MTTLTIYADDDAHAPVSTTTDGAEIALALAPLGVRFERWAATQQLDASASDDDVLDAYRGDIERLMAESGYRSVDVLRVTDATPDTATLRTKFLNEHTHDEDEIRFFVEGAGQFYLRAGGAIHAVLCERGDLIGVPTGTRHWFDMGGSPSFTAIRLYSRSEGWIARFTGDLIAARIPAYGDRA